MRKYIIASFVIILVPVIVAAQELDFDISVKAPTLDNADPKIFQTLEAEIKQLFNETRWTEDTYQDHEKIKGQLTLTVTAETSPTTFEGEITLVSVRPIYKSTTTTQLIRYFDKNVSFSYDGLQPIVKSDNSYIDNLSSILTYFAYIVLAVDYDSFSSNGGEPYYDKAYDVYAALPQGLQRGDSGWSSDNFQGQNRYFLVENARNPSLRAFRAAYYDYHRLAIDNMYDDPHKSRAVMMSAITQIGETERNYPRSIFIRMFSDAKKLELANIFKGASNGEKSKLKKIMGSIDPSNNTIFNNLR